MTDEQHPAPADEPDDEQREPHIDQADGTAAPILSGPVNELPMREQPHGGTLRTGGTNTGGPGRPTNAFRGRVFRSLEERFHIAEQIADGVPVKQTRIEVADVVPFVRCMVCGASEIGPKIDLDGALYVTIRGLGSASPTERLNALIMMSRLSIGEVKDVAADEVRERLARTLDAIRELVTDDTAYMRIIKAIQPIWTDKAP